MNATARRMWPFSVIAAVALATACSGGSGGAGPSVATSGIAIVPGPSTIGPAAGPLDAVVLFDPYFPNPTSEIATFTARDGSGATIANARWTSSNAIVAVDPPAGSGYDLPSPPPGGIVAVASGHGRADLTVTAHGATATLPIFSYGFVVLGCDIRADSNGSFDPDAPAAANAPGDFYVTVAGASAPCAVAVNTPPAQSYEFHFPYGATFVTDGTAAGVPPVQGAQSGPSFPFVPSTLWRNDFTVLDEPTFLRLTSPCSSATPCDGTPAYVILFKTAEGRIVKLLDLETTGSAVYGAYEVSDLAGKFPY